MKKKYYSLRWQITIFILLSTVIFSSITLYITYRYVNKMLTESLIEQGRIVAANISELAAENLIENDIVALKSIIEKYKYFTNIEYIIIEDFDSQIKTDTYNRNVPEDIVSGHNFDETNENSEFQVKKIFVTSQNLVVYDILQPIKEGLLGFVRVGMSKSYVDARIQKTIFYIGIVFVVGTFLAIIIALIIITLQISKPIAHLTNMAYKISMGDFNLQVMVRVKNEIGVLAEAVERMRESLKTSMERLRQR